MNRRDFIVSSGAMAGYAFTPGGRDDDVEDLRKEIRQLKREVAALQQHSLRGGKVRVRRPDGALILGDVPIIIDDTGIHFKEEDWGDGLFWDELAKASSIQGKSSATTSEIRLLTEGTPGTQLALSHSFNFLVGGTSCAVFTRPSGGLDDDDTGMELRYKPGVGAEKRTVVVVGAADSGGAGYRLLRVIN